MAPTPDPDADLPRAERRRRNLGIVLLVAAVACFACLDTAAKYINQTTNPLQTAAIRYLCSFLIVTMVFNPWRRPGILRTRRPGLQVARALGLVVATVSSFFALHYLPLTQATAITFASPLMVAVLAGPLLGEWLGRRQAAAVAIGFAGVLVVTRPWSAGLHPAVLLSALTACANAFYAITTRRLAGVDSSQTTLFYTNLVGAAVFLPVLPFVWDPAMAWLTWLLMIGVAGFGAVGHGLLILAHARTPASVLAPFFYAQLIWAGLLGFVVFGEVPDRWTLLGGTIVIGSGLYLLARAQGGRR